MSAEAAAIPVFEPGYLWTPDSEDNYIGVRGVDTAVWFSPALWTPASWQSAQLRTAIQPWLYVHLADILWFRM